MKIFAVVDHLSDWYPHHAIGTLKKHTALEFVDAPEAADLIWIFSYYQRLDPILAPGAAAAHRLITRLFRHAGILRESALGRALLRRLIRRKASLRGKPVIASFHHLDKAKEPRYISTLRLIDEVTDFVHFFSRVNLDANRAYFRKPTLLLPYWIDTKVFSPASAEAKARAREAFGIPADRMTVGSFQRDTEADGSPKLEKGPDLFCAVVERLDPEKVFVVLAGPRREFIERRLDASGIPYVSLGHVPFERMNELYACLDCYLVTSRCEGGPQAILESMAAGVPILSTRVGVSDLLSERVVMDGDVVESFVAALNAPYPDVLDEHRRRIAEYDCAVVTRVYERAFDELWAAGRGAIGPDRR